MTRKRIVALMIIVLVFGSYLVLRLVYLQVFTAGHLKNLAEIQRFRAVQVLPKRGAIYDRLGNELAISIDADCVYAVPAEINNPVKTAEIISSILTLDPNRLRKSLTKKASFVWVKRQVNYEEIVALRKIIKEQRLSGIEICQKAKRFYPQGSLAAQLIGIAGIDNQGLEGLEKYYDQYLKGVPGSDLAEYDTSGHHIPQGERRYLPPISGNSLKLTIDQNIQYIIERELEKAVKETGSKRGMSLAVDPRNGEILAVASTPGFDPNKYQDFPGENRRNPLFSDMYEPGSSFKIFTAAAALEEGKVNLTSTFFDPGHIVVEDRILKCWKAGGHGSQDFTSAMENSCNPVFVTLALRLTKETFYKYIRAFGFGSPLGVDFPGETSGYLQPLSKVKDVELATIGFGQGISVTPLQLVMGVAAVANGGYLLKPHLIKEVISPEGKLVKRFKRQVVRQVLSPKTSQTMVDLLKSVVTNGSGNRAYLAGYRIAGKTATAQKVVVGQRGYKQIIASFVAFAPADNPQVVAVVILDEPNSPIRYGGVIAAPVMGNIFRDVLRYLKVKPKYEAEMLEQIIAKEKLVPDISGRPLAEAISLLRKAKLEYRIVGTGKRVYDQLPKPGFKIPETTQIILYTEAVEE